MGVRELKPVTNIDEDMETDGVKWGSNRYKAPKSQNDGDQPYVKRHHKEAKENILEEEITLSELYHSMIQMNKDTNSKNLMDLKT